MQTLAAFVKVKAEQPCLDCGGNFCRTGGLCPVADSAGNHTEGVGYRCGNGFGGAVNEPCNARCRTAACAYRAAEGAQSADGGLLMYGNEV